MRQNASAFIVRCTVDGAEARLVVDTGANSTVLLNPGFVARHELWTRHPRYLEHGIGGVTGATAKARLVRSPEVQIGPYRFKDVPVVLSDPKLRVLEEFDGLLGIGGRPGLREDAVAAMALFPDVPVVAVDTPSGVDVDTGRLAGPHVRADLTVTFGTHKICHLVEPAAAACGAVHLVDIGLDLPAPALEAFGAADVAAMIPTPRADDHKYTRGVVGVRTGSATYPGAAVLGVAGAVSGLCGMVRYSGGAADAVRAAHPEVVAGEGRVQAWVVGSGSGDDAGPALERALRDDVPVVVDADALLHVRAATAPMVLTPHAGELAAMLGVDRTEVEADQLAFARHAAQEYDAVVLLKGRHTLAARPDGFVRVTTSGTPWLAVAGAGDVLAGVIGALLAAGLDPFDAASAGSWLHGAAASYASAGGPLTSARVAAAVPEVVAGLLG